MVRVLSREIIKPKVITPPPPGSWGERYRTGVWTPVREEVVAEDLEVIQGVVPKDLSGCYIRNTENPVHDSIDGNVNYHPFDGDGMLHMIRFKDGKTSYRNKFVRTTGFKEEAKAGRSLWPGLLERLKSRVKGERPGWGPYGLKDTASTDVVVHAGKILPSWYLCGEAYRLNLETLETEGINKWSPWEGVSAHCKVDLNTGELLFFNYGIKVVYTESCAEPEGTRTEHKFFINYGEVNKQNQLVNYQRMTIDVPIPGLGFPHDMSFSENYSIVNYFNEKSHFGIIPRHGKASEVRWFEASHSYVLHLVNAYEDGDEVVLDGYHMADPSAFTKFDTLNLQTCKPQLWRWRFNMKTGRTTERCIDERTLEFGMFNQRWAGKDYKYVYSAHPDVEFMFTGVTKHNLKTGESVSLENGPDRYNSEAPFAPKVGGTDEDDGYLISFVTDMGKDRSECIILDAKHIEDGPVATILLPHRISSGTHSCWADDADTAIVTTCANL